MTLTRRQAVHRICCTAALATLTPKLAFAKADTDRRFVFVFLRGGMDGLSAVPPYGEPRLQQLRGEIADAPPRSGGPHQMLALDGLFALNPELEQLHDLYQKGELLVVHAVASPYRERSHFDAQDVMETGAGSKLVKTGWLNRAIGTLPGAFSSGRRDVALGIGASLPLVLRGDQAVGSWSPATLPPVDRDTLDRIGDLYSRDPVLAEAFAKARSAAAMAGGMSTDDMTGGQGTGNALFFTQMAQVAAEFLRAADGPRIATLDYGNWDSHAAQNERVDGDPERFIGRFPELYRGLDRGIAILRDSLGADVWAKTVVLAVTEFGRTVRVNGTKGTDHGTAGAMFLAGGAVAGGRIIADWPGLADKDLYQNRDLRPTLDSRQVFKGVLREQLQVSDAQLEEAVFPETRALSALEGLLRT